MRNHNVPRLKVVSGRVSPQGGGVRYPPEFAALFGPTKIERRELSFHEQFYPIPAKVVDAALAVFFAAAIGVLVYVWTVEALS